MNSSLPESRSTSDKPSAVQLACALRTMCGKDNSLANTPIRCSPCTSNTAQETSVSDDTTRPQREVNTGNRHICVLRERVVDKPGLISGRKGVYGYAFVQAEDVAAADVRRDLAECGDFFYVRSR